MILESALLCLALNIYGENKFNGYDGMASVAVVTMNRADHDPNKVCDAVFKKFAFSWANPLTTVSQKVREKRAKDFLPKNKVLWAAAKVVAKQALEGKLDSYIYAEVGNSDHYFNPDLVSPKWQYSMKKMTSIGNHDFYDSKG